MIDHSTARLRMVQRQIEARGIGSGAVLEAMRTVPRHLFVKEGMEEFAYEDGPLPIGEEQTISQPYIVALMIEAAELTPRSRVLEVGAGSGYAAAVASRIAARVFAIERHESLARAAQERLARLGYDNVTVRAGDGTKGWEDEAPFDAILVAAGGEDIPQALKAQLSPGGRLIVPIGEAGGVQILRKLTRTGEDSYAEESLGAVRFVPLVSDPPPEDGTRSASNHLPGHSKSRTPEQLVAEASEPLPDIDDPDFGAMFDRFADARVVLLGEASHGTSEFYRARAAITRRLIEEHGFTIVAVEADWPDAAAVDRYVRHKAARETPQPFGRFPTWMWRNTDIATLTHWMREHNEGLPEAEQAGFYGLDLYSMNASIGAVLDYLDEADPEAAAIARERYGCLTPYQRDPAAYGRAALNDDYKACEEAVIRQCRELLEARLDDGGGEGLFDAAQNARLVAAAERYYRIMYYGGAESWNLRDTHMVETLEQLLDAKGPDAKAVVWAHNSHIGDARHTEMGRVRDEVNLGQLCRERIGNCRLIGFGTHTGTVAAASDWGSDMEVKRVRPSLEGSVERLCHEAGEEGAGPRFLLDLREGEHEAMRRALLASRIERFIGVIYRPETERLSHYADVSLPRQFDAYAFFDETEAVTPLGPEHAAPGMPDTYPFGL